MHTPSADRAQGAEAPTAPSGLPPAVETVNLHRRFGTVTALDGVSVTIRSGEFFALLGPSGCGKTTLLRVIAGLDLPDSGELCLGGRETLSVPAHRRPVNTVFQSYALFPHMTVQDNVGFGLRMKNVAAPEIVTRTRRAMELVEISDLADRRPAQLSGGQKQRVALARAVVNEPQVLLLDEPLGALDLKLRRQLQGELHALQRRLGITFIHVTHDQEEALALSDRIAVMNRGRIEQLGGARELYERPRTRFVAQFLGSCNLLEGVVEHRDESTTVFATRLGAIEVAGASVPRPLSPGARVTLAIRPERVSLADAAVPGLRACVRGSVYTGSETQYALEAEGLALKAWVMNHQGGPGFAAGQQVSVKFPATAVVILDD